jgi:GT2 family glycosyltransferase
MLRLSFIIIGRNTRECTTALEAVGRVDLSNADAEILLSCGVNPSLQRNRAAEHAQGEYLVFLDNDSIVDRRLVAHLSEVLGVQADAREAGVIGGPAIYKSKKKGRVFQAVFSSVFALGPFRARYVPMGLVRRVSEFELILCNLIVRRDLFLVAGGFDVTLFPNEENEFLRRVADRTKFYYHPLAVCVREPPHRLKDFCGQIFRYGMGRARMLLISKQSNEFFKREQTIFIIPFLFTTAVLALFFVGLVTGWHNALPLFVMLGFHLIFGFAAATFAALGYGNLSFIFLLPLLFLICHFTYGLGLVVGFILAIFGGRQSLRLDEPTVTVVRRFSSSHE